MSYLLGDSDAAASRLRLLGEVFAPSTVEFVKEAVPEAPERLLDLGCGPGHTTRLQARVLGPRQATGLDASARFIAEADRAPMAGVSFGQHDVTRVPFPGGPADVVYCRFLLIHLSRPLEVAGRWLESGVRAGGRLLVEELEGIVTREPAFRRYLDMVATALAEQDNRLYVGPVLAALRPGPEAVVEINRVTEIRIPREVAARMFVMNLPALREKPFIRENYSEVLDGLQEDLSRLADAGGAGGEPVLWRLRQMAVRKNPSLPR